MKNQAPDYRYVCGNVCRDPQKMTTASGKDFYIFDLAVHHKDDITEFISVSCWSPTVKKGDFVRIDGPVRMRKKMDGTLKAWINAQHIIMLKSISVERVNSTVNA